MVKMPGIEGASSHAQPQTRIRRIRPLVLQQETAPSTALLVATHLGTPATMTHFAQPKAQRFPPNPLVLGGTKSDAGSELTPFDQAVNEIKKA